MKGRVFFLVWAALLGSGGLGAQSLPPRLLSDILPGKGEGLSSNPFSRTYNPRLGWGDSFVRIGNVFYFSAMDCRHGRELWISDGTGGGGVLDLVLPGDPVLAGVRIAAQAVSGPSASGPWGMDFTNGLLLTLGY